MADDKSLVADHVFRAHFGQAFCLVPKASSASASTRIPTPALASGTIFETLTSLVIDISLAFNSAVYFTSGKQFLKFFRDDIDRAFAHPQIHTVVLVADQKMFPNEAKIPVQKKRAEKSRDRATRLGIVALDWNENNPTPIIVDDTSPMPSMESIKATAGALRYAMIETLSIMARDTPPAGRRVIFHYQPMMVNPKTAADFLPDNISELGIRVREEAAETVVAMRQDIAQREINEPHTWRSVARGYVEQLAGKGWLEYIPLCVETSISNIPYEPFRLFHCRFTSSEADTAAQRWTMYLHFGEIGERLVGKRVAKGMASAKFYSAEQKAAMQSIYQTPVGQREFFIGARGAQHPQRSAVISVDSDFFVSLVTTVGRQYSDWDSLPRHANEPAIDVLGPHSPVLIRGDVYTVDRKPLVAGECRYYGTEAEVGARKLVCSHEIFVPAIVVAELMRRGTTSSYPLPLEAIKKYAADRSRASLEKREENASIKKRKLDAPDGPAQMLPMADAAAGFEESGAASIPVPVIRFPPLPLDATPIVAYERLLSFLDFINLLGCDYLGGFSASRFASYAAYCDMLVREPKFSLVRLSREILPPAPDPCKTAASERLPSQLAHVGCPGSFLTLVKYCYYFGLHHQLHAANRPALPPDKTTIATVNAICKNKWKTNRSNDIPSEHVLGMWFERKEWLRSYILNAPMSIARVVDPAQIGWNGKEQDEIY